MERWSVGFGGTRSFTVANGILYYGSTVGGVIGRLTALNASSGAFLWSYDAGLVVTTPAVANGIAYFGADDRNVYALNASTGAFIWSAQTGGTAYVGPVANGKVYAAYNFGLSAFNASTGALIWVKASFVGASAVARGVLYATATSP